MLQDPTSTALSGSSIPGWRTNPDAASPIVVPDATLALIAPPSAGEVDVASDPYTVSADGNTQGNVVITPTIVSAPVGGSGVFTPTTLTINSSSTPSDSFTFTPDTVGDYEIGITNDRSLTNPDPVAYQAQSPYVPPDLETNWIVDLHPLRTFDEHPGFVPAGCADHVGEKNAFNAQTQVAGQGVASITIGAAGSGTAGTLDADSLTRNAYEWLQIIEDPDNAARNAFVHRLDKTATNWESNKGKAIRAQLNSTGDPRRIRPWGARTWWCTAFRIPAAMKTITQPGFIDLANQHTSQNDLGTGGGHCGIFFNPGGAIPENSSLYVSISTWDAPNWPDPTGGNEGPKYNRVLFSGGPNVADQVPEDEWIIVAVDYRLWHGYPDPNANPVPTPTGPFYVKPYIAVGTGDVIAKAPYTGTWGYPYGTGANNGWDRPTYPISTLYSNPKNGSNWTSMEVMNLGMREWLVSDIEAANPGRTITAHDIIAAFRASRLITPP